MDSLGRSTVTFLWSPIKTSQNMHNRLSRVLRLQGLQKKTPAPAPKIVDAEKAVLMEEKQPLVVIPEGRTRKDIE